jgi:hypothetical protein
MPPTHMVLPQMRMAFTWQEGAGRSRPGGGYPYPGRGAGGECHGRCGPMGAQGDRGAYNPPEGLATKRDAGVRLGRPQALSPKVVTRIVKRRTSGKTLQAIADELTADGIAAARGGGIWHASSVAAVLRSQAAKGGV